ncbi:MAG: hypothetical protein J5I92_11905 [Thiogranum sp.]|nr:hypothetical protein [Thiogranum sp.]
MTCRLTGLLLLLLLSGAAAALERIQLDWGNVASDSWRLENLSLVLDWDAAGQSRLTVSVARIELDDYRFDKVRLVCGAFELLPGQVDCRQGRLSLQSEQLDADAVPAALNYRFASGELNITVRELPVADGKLSLTLNHTAAAWRLTADLQSCTLAGTAQLLADAGLEMPALTYQGRVSGALAVRGDAQALQQISWQLDTQQAGYSNAEGSQAAEALVLTSSGTATPMAGDWRVEASLGAREGMLYADPLYLEFSDARRLALDARALWKGAAGELQLQSLAFRQSGVAAGTLQGVLVPAADQPLQRLDLTLEQAWLPGLYETWLQPWLAGTVLGELETAGQLHGRLQLSGMQPQALELQLQRLSFREKNGLFGVQDLDADLHWDNSELRRVSALAWQGASFHRLQLGAAALQLETAARELKLQQPLAVPLLDGTLQVEQFELGLDDGGVRWLLDGVLTPVSMQAFSNALGWPTLAGKLSGMVPKVRYENGELTVGGILLVQAFDGDITVRNLRIRDPLGLAPRLWADVKIADLDLDTLTRTFSFGRIEGRFEGEVKDLYMEAWQPVAFDAMFRTPPDDDSRHRISQKAVDNISNLGGAGVGGAVSRSFLRVLEDFPYKRLGIRCRLENGVCRMGGVAPAERGYYLVEGTFLPPRLDVIGYSERVDWESLVQRLVAVTTGGGAPVTD